MVIRFTGLIGSPDHVTARYDAGKQKRLLSLAIADSSLVLEEAPVAKLVPYRYPRPAMARMTALIEDAAARGARIMNLSGSTNREEWLPFQKAAEEHPDMLFVVAAGNYGRNIGLRVSQAMRNHRQS